MKLNSYYTVITLCSYKEGTMQLSFRNINKYFEDFHVLNNISFTISSGQIFGFLGRNGAGKTTMIRILMDIFKADSGTIELDSKVFDPEKHKIGYLPEERGMYDKSKVKDQLVYFSMLRGADKKSAIESVEYWTERFEIDHYLGRRLETLSKGNQQKVQITQAFLNEPDILILDEPFSGLDPVNSSLFQEALMEYISDDKLIIFSSHQMSYVESFCDDIVIIDAGKIILEGKLTKIKKDMGENKIRISSSNNDLKEFLKHRKISFAEDKTSLIIKVPEIFSHRKFLKEILNENIEIDLYSLYTPSLQEIFVSKVGEVE